MPDINPRHPACTRASRPVTPGSRGLLWLGVYAALALAPLAVAALVDPVAVRRTFAVELAVALGFVAFALIALEFALVARVRALSAPLGTDALMLFHRTMGLAALGFLLAHAWLLRPAGLARLGADRALLGGTLALAAVLLLVASSVHRRRIGIRYETWQLLHRMLSLLVAAAMLFHVLAIDVYARAAPVKAVVIGYTALFLSLLVLYRIVRPVRLWMRPWEIAANRYEGGDTHTLTVRPVGHAGLEFEPGQFAWLITGKSPFVVEQHPMTISSSSELPPDGSLQLSIKALGDWSGSVVPHLAPGARVWLDGPFGAFTIDRAPAQGFVLIAGGIGITPMRSFLLSMRDRADRRPVLLFYAARNRERAPFVEELRALEQSLQLRTVLVFAEPEPGCASGFVTTELLRRALPANHAQWQFFVCGPGAMMDAMERSLRELGVGPERIHTERYDML